jgi:cytochrome c biogenesis protein CcmG, thiol:disulfide interchange protein DsbE
MTAVPQDGIARHRILVLIPLAVFLGLAVLFYVGLSGNPAAIPSVLIGRPAPATQLPPIEGLERDGAPVPGIDARDFHGRVTLVNVWASWCVPCRDEAPFLVRLAFDQRVRLVGINYKDQAENARRFLVRFGNPFAASGADTNGRASIEWGVYGVPESFVVDREGRIAFKLVGPITETNFETALIPSLNRALAAAGTP